MNVAKLPWLRVAFLCAERDTLHVPARCSWADARVFAVRDGVWTAAVEKARRFGAEVCVVLRPQEVGAEQLASAPGLKVEVTSPLPIDVERCLLAPDLDAAEVAVPEWARPPPAVLERLRLETRVRAIPADAPPLAWPDLLAGVGAVAYWTTEALHGVDPFPLVVLANGVLLASNAAFPEAWAIEPEDEYLHRPAEDDLAHAVLEALRVPQSVRAIRARAWQKAREAFSADAAYQRLVHDALLFAGAQGAICARGVPPMPPRDEG
jgi:hypothetical protein